MNSVVSLCKYFLCLIIVFLLSCNPQKAQPNLPKIIEKGKQNDSITSQREVNQEKYVPLGDFDFRLTDDTLNFEKVLIKQLTERPNKSKFVIDSLLTEGFGGQWYFWQGHLFSKKRKHALVFINGAGLPIFIFEKKEEGWQSVIRIDYPKPLVNAEKTIDLRDLNYDGTIDLGINHGDFGGHYSCTNCYRVYLYNDTKNIFVPKSEFNNQLDVQFDSSNKTVYLGSHVMNQVILNVFGKASIL